MCPGTMNRSFLKVTVSASDANHRSGTVAGGNDVTVLLVQGQATLFWTAALKLVIGSLRLGRMAVTDRIRLWAKRGLVLKECKDAITMETDTEVSLQCDGRDAKGDGRLWSMAIAPSFPEPEDTC